MSEDGAESLQLSEQLPPQRIKDGSESSKISGTDFLKRRFTTLEKSPAAQ
jgi:hypothetical protein